MKEGFVKTTMTQTSCGLCRWHNQQMLRSGQHPIYEHFCQHPNVTAADDRTGSTLRVMEPLRKGAYIGRTSQTPGWCPVGERR